MKLKLWEIAYQDYVKGMKYAEIADKHKVSISCVKSWASRYWKKLQPEKVAELLGRKKIGAPYGNQNAKGHGAPKGNQNAKGHHRGAPKGSQNHLVTGERAAILPETFTAEEVRIFNADPTDPIEQIDYMIRIMSVREHRMLRLREELLQQRDKLRATGKGGDLIDDSILMVEKHGSKSHVQQSQERRLTEKILAIEDALTRVQEKKIRAIESKFRMLKARKAEMPDTDIQITIKRKERDG